MKSLRLICILGLLGICQYVFGASPIQETQTPTSYTMTWNETGKNGGTVKGVFSGPMKDGKRNGRWTADVKFNLFGDEQFRTGSITMVRCYKDGVPDGPYTYNFDVNWRDGAYNPHQGKWIYGSPSGYKETVSGSFKMGRPDGAWTIKSDKKLGYECQMTFKNGIPVGKRVYHDGIMGKGNEEFNEEGLLIGIVSDDGNGWRYKDASNIPSDKRIPYNMQRFFHLETEDDYNYFARACELYEWLSIYPYRTSNEEISYEAYQVKDGEGLEYIEYVGSPEYVNRMESANEKRKRNVISDEYIKEIELARDSINNLFKMTEEEAVFFKHKGVNVSAPKKKEAWTDYLNKRHDIIEFVEAHKSGNISNDKLKLERVIDEITEEFEFNQDKYNAAIHMLKSAEIEALNWGAKNKDQIRKKALLCYPGYPANNISFEIISDRTDGDGKGSFDVVSNTIQNLNSSYMSLDNAVSISEKKEWYSWLMDQYSYTPISDISALSDEDLFLWAVADNMRFDNYGNFQLIDKKIKKPERVLQAVNAIREKIPSLINLDNITVNRIGYGSVTQSGVGTYSMKQKRRVNAGEVYQKAKNNQDWLKLKESFMKVVEKASKKKK